MAEMGGGEGGIIMMTSVRVRVGRMMLVDTYNENIKIRSDHVR